MRCGPKTPPNAQVAELVDALVSGTSGESRGGSSPLLGTTVFFINIVATFCANSLKPVVLNLVHAALLRVDGDKLGSAKLLLRSSDAASSLMSDYTPDHCIFRNELNCNKVSGFFCCNVFIG